MSEPIDLELVLRRRNADYYDVELRGRNPDSDTLVSNVAKARFDLEQLLSLAHDPTAYGSVLGSMLFADDTLRVEFSNARTAAQTRGRPLRLRLAIARDTLELHGLYWETLRDPHSSGEGLLSVGEQVFLSRYLASPDWQTVRLRAQGALRALIVVANPPQLGSLGLAPIDVEHEVAIARRALAPLNAAVLGLERPATLEALMEELGEGYDILYLVAHARTVEGATLLYLDQAPDGERLVPVTGSALTTRVSELLDRPRLAILAACQSAEMAEAAALTAIGPALAIAGVPAVLAMQGLISVETIELLLPKLFEALGNDGRIDRALSIARGRIRERPDFWMPVLFMRLTSGQLWYTPGFTGGDYGPAAGKWGALIDEIRNQHSTPILGPDLIEVMAGARRDLARKLAEDFHFPLASHDREGLPQVAQFLAVDQGPNVPLDRIVEYLCAAIRQRSGAGLPEELRSVDLRRLNTRQRIETLHLLLCHAWEHQKARNPNEPYKLLAELPIPIYLTTDQSDLLLEALRAADRRPQELFCPWNDHTRSLPSPFADEAYTPEAKRPLVFRLFGSFRDPESLVLTEDQHFEYLIGVERYKEDIPEVVRAKFANSALLFLGLRPEDWAFRVFFRILMSQQGGQRRSRYPHIAVQVAPEEGRMIEPGRARQYLEDYFAEFLSDQTRINIYWGSSQDFAREMRQRL
jgi:hypothetical protein